MAGWLGKLTGLFRKEAQPEQETRAPETGNPVLERLHQLEVMDKAIADQRAEGSGLPTGVTDWGEAAEPGAAEIPGPETEMETAAAPPDEAFDAAAVQGLPRETASPSAEDFPREAAWPPPAAEEPAGMPLPEEVRPGVEQAAGAAPEPPPHAPDMSAGEPVEDYPEPVREAFQASGLEEAAAREATPEAGFLEETAEEEEEAQTALGELEEAFGQQAPALEEEPWETAAEDGGVFEAPTGDEPLGTEAPRDEPAPEGRGVAFSWDEAPAEDAPAPFEGEGEVFEDERSPVKVRMLPDPEGHTAVMVTDGLNGYGRAELIWVGVPYSFQAPAAAILLALGSYIAEGAQLGAGESLSLRDEPPVAISLHEPQEEIQAVFPAPVVQVGIVNDFDGSHSLEFNDVWLSNALLSQGLDDMQDGKYEEAERDFTELLGFSPQEAAHWLLRARARFFMEHYEEALTDCQQAAQHDQESAEVFALGGACLVRLGMTEDARQLFEQALALEPGNELAGEELQKLDQG